MLRIQAPFAARTHPLVTGIALCARLMQRRHTIVFTPLPPAPDRGGRSPQTTLKGLSSCITLELEGGPRIQAPSLLSAALLMERASVSGGATSSPIGADVLGALATWESRTGAVLEAFDELALAVSIQHYTGVMSAHTYMCDALKVMDETLKAESEAEATAGKALGPLASAPLFPAFDFLVNDARLPVSPYDSIQALMLTPSTDMKRVGALVRSTAAAYPAHLGGGAKGDTVFGNAIPLAHAFIRKIQSGGGDGTAKKMPSLADAAGKARGNMGAQGASSFKKPTGSIPSARRDVM